MKKVINHPHWISLALLTVSLIAYGGLILRPGAFGEDVSILWLYQRSGLSGLQAYFGSSQPLSALLTGGLLNTFGMQMWIYHLIAVLLRWLGAWAFWLLIREVWPGQDGKTLLAALVFLIFPGMEYTPLALSILPHLLALALTGSGFLLLYQAIVEPQRRRLHFTAAWMTGFAMLLSPYFIGLEAARMLLIWKGWKNDKKLTGRERVKRSALTWLPYVLPLAARFALGWPLEGQGGAISLSGGARNIARNVLDVLVLAWRQIFTLPADRSQIPGFALAVVVAGLLVFLLLRSTRETKKAGKKTGIEAKPGQGGFLLTGAGLLIAGGLPLWLGRSAVGLTYPNSVTVLAFLPGAALLTAALFDLLLLPRFQAGLAALAVALAVGAQFQNTSIFISEWQRVETIVQQLQNRLPAVKEGTLLVSEQVPLDYYSEENLSALLNLAYFPTRRTETDGLLYLNAGFETAGSAEGLVEKAGRGFRFSGSMDQSASFYKPEKGCLRLLQAGETDPRNLPMTLGQSVAAFKMESVVPVRLPNLSPPELFQSSAVADRCSQLERIEWANQQGNWKEAGRLLALGGTGLRQTEQLYELAPLVEAAAHEGDAIAAAEIASEAVGSEGAPYELCRVFERIDQAAEVSATVKQALDEVKNRSFCDNYD